jgi:hypothetical protein
MRHSWPQTTSLKIPPYKLHRRLGMCCVVSWLAKEYALLPGMLSVQATMRAVQQEEAVAVRRCSNRIYCINSLLPVRLSDSYLVGAFLHLLIFTFQLQCWHVPFAGCCGPGFVLSSLVLLWPRTKNLSWQRRKCANTPSGGLTCCVPGPNCVRVADSSSWPQSMWYLRILCEWHFSIKGRSNSSQLLQEIPIDTILIIRARMERL